ncbi:hypothetical protein Mgra_00004809 [Meloidogyne graminicola]|uniref:Uncharacterized protein n=1 Tax=Meloidogyne graminicola TaxID=189291 RepID=A0A8S9ZRN4_9BILA|nr:hypothetical protein Mgra_00004809 [Meloidogyne graminicola]
MFVCKYSLLLFLIFCQFNVIKSMNNDEENTEIFDDLDDIVTDYKEKKPIYRPSYYKYSSDLHLEREIKKAVSNILEEKWLKIKNNSGPLKPSPSVSNFKKPRNLFFDKTNFQMIKLEDILPNYYKEKAVKQLKTTGKRSERKRKNFKNLELDEFPKIKFDNGESSNSKLNEKMKKMLTNKFMLIIKIIMKQTTQKKKFTTLI